MGMLDNWIRDLTAPLRQIKSKFMGAKNIKDGLVGDIDRLKRSVGINPNQQNQNQQKPPEKK
jgi:hypothetical protein